MISFIKVFLEAMTHQTITILFTASDIKSNCLVVAILLE
jgi:hypothetical protein